MRPSSATLGVSLLAMCVMPLLGMRTPPSDAPRIQASERMALSLLRIRELRRAAGIPVDRTLDPNDTGIVGDEFSTLTTSLGDVAAKRTAANPAFAGVITGYFQSAGLKRGDVVAIGASGSFPALILATLSAARALELEPVAIYSVGSSMYGANLPGFTFVDMLNGLRRDGLLPYQFVAVAPGGADDAGRGVLFDETGDTLMREARRSGLPVIGGPSLEASIQERLRVFAAAARGRPVRCFVNIGGASASFGDTPASLDLANGLVRRVASIPSSPTRGLVFEFLSRGVPVIHLLHVRGLTEANHLPFDPVPFPALPSRPGE
ncbi:MAG: poly-gamma-glutamate system protein [Vicinamibacterales bacterium]|nr:poly-gamma-glutamate system protein [Vicinamibacterales bacterium]